MKVKELPISEIKIYENNPRKNEKAVDSVAQSIKSFGFKIPIILDKENVIVAGHTRLKAAHLLGLEKIPVIYADDLTEEQIKAFRLADNKVAQLSTWNMDRLEEELENLDEADWVTELFQKAERNAKSYENNEINLDDFFDEVFEYECPCCGFRFNKS